MCVCLRARDCMTVRVCLRACERVCVCVCVVVISGGGGQSLTLSM